MRLLYRTVIKRWLQKAFWIYWTNNFAITSTRDFRIVEPAMKCAFLPITLENYFRARDFREEGRGPEYRKKLVGDEIGFFAECGGKMVGSIWATVNCSHAPMIARTYVRLMPNEALIHDVVTSQSHRGLGVGPFMLSNLASRLLSDHGSSRIIIDVSIRNRSSLRMMEKIGLRANEQVLSVSAFSKPLLQKTVRQY